MKKQLRRTLLKSLGIGSVWTTPTISSVILPAHAETSIVSPVDEAFGSAGTAQFTVPDGITQLKITVNGAGGGTANYLAKNAPMRGGNGEQLVQTVAAVPGDTLSITVGGGGQNGQRITGGQKMLALNIKAITSNIPGTGGNPGDGEDAYIWGGGGGGYSQVTGTGIDIQAGGGGGGFGSAKLAIQKNGPQAKAGDGGGSNGGEGASNGENGEDAGNGLGGLGSTTAPTDNDPPQHGEDGSVLISSS